jgi:hypothetical protein
MLFSMGLWIKCRIFKREKKAFLGDRIRGKIYSPQDCSTLALLDPFKPHLNSPRAVSKLTREAI